MSDVFSECCVYRCIGSHNCITLLMNRQHNTPRTHHCPAQLTLHTGAGLSWALNQTLIWKFIISRKLATWTWSTYFLNFISIEITFKGHKPTATELQHDKGRGPPLSSHHKSHLISGSSPLSCWALGECRQSFLTEAKNGLINQELLITFISLRMALLLIRSRLQKLLHCCCCCCLQVNNTSMCGAVVHWSWCQC